MPGRYELLDSDEDRLPDGMERVGYDADTQTYTYQDEQGNYYQGEAGTRYGQLRRTGTRGPVNRNPAATYAKISAFKSDDWRYMAPFFLIVVVILLLVWYWFGPTFIFRCDEGQEAYQVKTGDTCWEIAKEWATTVDELKKINRGLSCDSLKPGVKICLP